MNNIQIPFELFADLFDYFFAPDAMDVPLETEQRIKEGLHKKAVAILRREDYAERLKERKQEQENS